MIKDETEKYITLLISVLTFLSMLTPFLLIRGDVTFGMINTSINGELYFTGFSYSVDAPSIGMDINDTVGFNSINRFDGAVAPAMGSHPSVNISFTPYTNNATAPVYVVLNAENIPWWVSGEKEGVDINIIAGYFLNVSDVTIKDIRLEIQKEGKLPMVIWSEKINRSINEGDNISLHANLQCPETDYFYLVGAVNITMTDTNGESQYGIETPYTSHSNLYIKITPISQSDDLSMKFIPVSILLFWVVFLISIFYIIAYADYVLRGKLRRKFVFMYSPYAFLLLSLVYLVIMILGYTGASTLAKLLNMSNMLYPGYAMYILAINSVICIITVIMK